MQLFHKSQVCGNHFVILEATSSDFLTCTSQELTRSCMILDVRDIADVKRGIGFDQLIIYQRTDSEVLIRIFNNNGQEALQCGNGLLATAKLLNLLHGLKEICFRTQLDTYRAWVSQGIDHQERITVDLKTPYNYEVKYDLEYASLRSPVFLEVGNPHLVFIVNDIQNHDLDRIGSHFNEQIFPKGINVELIEIINPRELKMRVYERGTGITSACGSGAAASVFVARKLGLVDKQQQIAVHLAAISTTSSSVDSSSDKLYVAVKGKHIYLSSMQVKSAFYGFLTQPTDVA